MIPSTTSNLVSASNALISYKTRFVQSKNKKYLLFFTEKNGKFRFDFAANLINNVYYIHTSSQNSWARRRLICHAKKIVAVKNLQRQKTWTKAKTNSFVKSLHLKLGHVNIQTLRLSNRARKIGCVNSRKPCMDSRIVLKPGMKK